MHMHLVLVTTYRRRVFSDRYLTRMEEVMRAVCADVEAELIEFNGEADHVHLLVSFPPTVAASKQVNSITGVASRRLRQESPISSATTGAPHTCGPGRPSPGPSAGRRCPACG